jgi:hypothetical protein
LISLVRSLWIWPQYGNPMETKRGVRPKASLTKWTRRAPAVAVTARRHA